MTQHFWDRLDDAWREAATGEAAAARDRATRVILDYKQALETVAHLLVFEAYRADNVAQMDRIERTRWYEETMPRLIAGLALISDETRYLEAKVAVSSAFMVILGISPQ